MIDFSTLGKISPEAIARSEAERRESGYAAEEAKRDADSRKLVRITLEHEPEMRSTIAGERFMLLRGREEGARSPLLAVYKVPDRIENEDRQGDRFDGMVRDLGGGDKVSLAGSWSKRRWRDAQNQTRESWEFKAQHFAKGDMDLGAVIERSKREFGPEGMESKVRPPIVRDNGMGGI